MTTLDRAEVVLGANDRELRTGLARARQATRSAGRQMRSIVNRIGKAFAAAFATAGAASTKFAADFEEELTKIETLVGINRDRVQGWRDDLQAMAVRTGVDLQNLTRALFRLTSGGIRGAEVLRSLRAAAESAASGMGSVEEISRLATSSVESFRSQGLTMKDALNTMLTTVREGSIVISSFQTALETVQKQAANAGISFQELGGFLATVSRTMPTRKAARGLRQFLLRLQDPTKDIREAFQQAGISVNEFRRQIRRRGLSGPLVELGRAAEAADVEMAKLFGRANAVASMTAVLGNTSEKYLGIADRVADRQGAVASAFERTRENLNFVRDQIIQVAKVVGIRLAQDAVGDLRAFGNEILNNSNRILQFGRIVTTAVGIAASAFRTGLGVIRMFLQDIGERIGALGAAVALLFEGEFTAAGEAAKQVIGGFSEETVSRFEEVQESADTTRQRIAELRAEVEEFRTMPARSIAGTGGEGGEGETQSGISFTPTTPSLRGGIGGGFRPQRVGQGGIVDPQQLANQLGIQWQRAGEDSGESFMDGMGRRLKQGAQSAMQALLSGLLRGKQNIEETLARIGISIASTLLTQGLFSGLGIASPAKEGIFAGEMLGEGLAVGMENTVRRVRQAASSVAVTAASAAATGGASVATPGAAGSVSARDGVIDASRLDPMGQVAAHVAMESPSLQRLFTAGTDDARKRRGER